MSCLFARLGVLACALCFVPGAAAAVHHHPAPSHAATGSVAALGADSVTLVTSGRRMGVVNAMIAAATTITREDYPYVWGGGHATAGAASVGIKGGPGYNGHRAGFDCSGSVAAVLVAGGLWPAGGGVPGDLGVIDELWAAHIIAPGPGRTPTEVTLYDEPGVHIFMNINGRFFGTSDGAGGGSRRGGPGWLDDGAPDAYARRFRQYHVLPSVLRDSTVYGHSFTLQSATPSLIGAVALGDRVRVSFRSGASGTLSLVSLSWIGAQRATATVAAIAADGSSITVLTASGQTVTFATPTAADLTQGLAVGDQVLITYTTRALTSIARAVTVTAGPVVSTVTGAVTAIAADGTSLSVQLPSGAVLTLSTAGQAQLLDGLQVGDEVQVSYVTVGASLIAQSVQSVAQSG